MQTNAKCQVSLQSLGNFLTYNERIKILNSGFSAESKHVLMSYANVHFK